MDIRLLIVGSVDMLHGAHEDCLSNIFLSVFLRSSHHMCKTSYPITQPQELCFPWTKNISCTLQTCCSRWKPPWRFLLTSSSFQHVPKSFCTWTVYHWLLCTSTTVPVFINSWYSDLIVYLFQGVCFLPYLHTRCFHVTITLNKLSQMYIFCWRLHHSCT